MTHGNTENNRGSWFKSNFSNNGGACYEFDFSKLSAGVVELRDSKDWIDTENGTVRSATPNGFILRIPVAAYAAFLEGTKRTKVFNPEHLIQPYPGCGLTAMEVDLFRNQFTPEEANKALASILVGEFDLPANYQLSIDSHSTLFTGRQAELSC